MRAARGCRQPGGLILTLGFQASGESAHQINSWWFDSRNEWEPFVAIEPLALRELEAASRLGLAVLLALDDSAVAGEEAALLQHGPQRRFEIGERAADAVPHRAGLA